MKTYELTVSAYSALDDCAYELSRAMSLHSQMLSPHEGYAIILEELDELWDEVKRRDHDPVAMKNEAVKLAAMALRFVADVCNLSTAE